MVNCPENEFSTFVQKTKQKDYFNCQPIQKNKEETQVGLKFFNCQGLIFLPRGATPAGIRAPVKTAVLSYVERLFYCGMYPFVRPAEKINEAQNENTPWTRLKATGAVRRQPFFNQREMGFDNIQSDV